MKRIGGILLTYFLTAFSLSAETYYVREVKLELEPLTEILEGFIIPFAQRQGYSQNKGYIEVDFEVDGISIIYFYDYSAFCCLWEDSTTRKSLADKTGVCMIGDFPVRIQAATDCPYVVPTAEILSYNYDCSEYKGFIGINDGVDVWSFIYDGSELKLIKVISFAHDGMYVRRMVPPGFTVEVCQ